MTVICVFTLLFIMMLGTATQAEAICEDVFPPLHGKLTMDRRNLYYIVRCEPGYIIEGKYLVHCRNGEWDSLPPKCNLDPTAKTCPEIDPPENGNKTCPDGPQFVGSHCRFTCHIGYELSGLTLRTCLPTAQWSGRTPKCFPITDQTCPVPPPLINGRVISCSPQRVPKVGRTCHFRCNPGYVLKGPPALFCRRDGRLTDADWKETSPECVAVKPGLSVGDAKDSDHPKQNKSPGDTDVNQHANSVHPAPENQPHFRPAQNRPGSRHQTTATPAPIQPAYRNLPGSGHQPQENRHVYDTVVGKETEKKSSSCEDNSGGCQHHCNLTRKGLIRCSCWNGYTLAGDSKSCVDIDECAEEMSNRCQHYCHNSVGSYRCSCKHGYIQINKYKCEGCKKDSYWSYESNSCTECPDNSFTDSEAKLSINDCQCLSGFTGSPRDNIACTDIDECADNYGCSHQCVNTPGSAFCSCPVGYILDSGNKTCIDMDECSIKNGGCQGNCHNTEGSFYCSCPEGYTSSNKDIYSCDDVDECLENNGGCVQKCNNYPGGHFCSCQDGYRIGSDLQKCTDIRCPSIPVPHYSTMKCEIGKSVLPGFDSYPVGAVCTFNCSKGFKNAGSSNKMKCQEDGTWTGTVPECKPQRCAALAIPENGKIHPSSCSTGGNDVKQKCTFTCLPGYHLKGKPVFKCRNDLTWSVNEIPYCQQERIHPTISCPADVSVDLHPGTNAYNITLSSPVTNADRVIIEPKWVLTDSPVQFPAGITNVVFKASVPNVKRFARCTTTVSVIDREAPVFRFCPNSIEIEDVGANGVLVTWREPIASDNVAVESLTSTLQPNSTLVPGTYTVEYFAKDAAGNVATCTFKIILKRPHCDDLADPENGEANCMHWMSGLICNPTCDEGYERHPNDTAFYSCEESGVWEPADVISDCLKIQQLTSMRCPDGYEIVESLETEEEICIECRANTFWSSSTRKCEEQDVTQ